MRRGAAKSRAAVARDKTDTRNVGVADASLFGHDGNVA